MKIHLIGICGTGMGSLAGLLKAAGHDVRGSDEHVYPPMSTQLEEQKIPCFEGFGAANLDWGPDAVVVGNVCRKDHVEVLAAQERGIPLESFPSLFSKLFLSDEGNPRRSVVVAGTHGKTTTSSLLAHVLADAGRDPSFLIGGVPLNFRRSGASARAPSSSSRATNTTPPSSTRGRSSCTTGPQVVLLTSVEFDHADIFRDEEAVRAAFRKFVALIPEDGLLVACAASPGAMEVARGARSQVVTYGRPGSGADWTFEVVARAPGGRTTLDVARRGERVVSVETNLPGIYNLENLVGMIAVAAALGVELPAIAQAVRGFLGVRRRQEVRGVARGVTVVDDFAHHPTAIRETVLALKGRFGPGKLIAAFEPRSATSRRNVFQTEFADALSVADEVVLAPLYAAEKVPEGERLDVERLAADLRREDVPARLIPTVDATVEHLATRASPGDTVLVMTSGDYGGLHDKLLRQLGDPVMPARLEHKVRIGNLLDRVGIAHPVLEQFWPSYLVIPGDDDAAALVGCVAIELVGRRRAAAHAGGRARAARRGARVRAGRGGDGARAHRRACGTCTWSPTARRATSARSSASRRSIARTSSRRSRRPPSTRWRVRRTRPGCARSCEAWERDPLEQAREVAVGIAREAGRILLAGWGTRPTVGFKGEDINLVTEYDKRSEALIVERLAAAFPRGSHRRARRGRPTATRAARCASGTSIRSTARPTSRTACRCFRCRSGCAINRRPVLGVVEAPALGWTFAGTITGGGSTFNGKPIVPVAGRSTGGRAAGHRLPVPAQPGAEQPGRVRGADGGGAGDAPARFGGAGSLLRRVRVARTATGSARCTPGIWSAGAAIVTGAGGRVTDLDGGAFDGETGRILASNGHIHDQMRRILQDVARDGNTPWP